MHLNFHFITSILICLIQTIFVTAAASSSSQLKVSPFDSPDFCSQIITPTCNTTFSYIDSLNAQVRPYLSKLVKSPFFKYFKLDLDKQCKFWNAQHFCATENCAVEVLPTSQYNWSDVINDDLKPSKLGEINRPDSTDRAENDENNEKNHQQICEDLDYSHYDDDHECVYVDLLVNPERFTGYGGSQSFDVWKAIYSENCFPNTNPLSMTKEEPEKCVEKNLFYRLISGMHASIAVHLSNEYLDSTTGEFYPNLEIFMERVGGFSDRLSNIYFNYAMITQSIVKLNELLSITDFIKKGDDGEEQIKLLSNEDSNYSTLLNEIIPSLSDNTLFNSSQLFNPKTVSPDLKDEFRSRFKNVSAIMDCVGCDRCRMWGKLQTIGYGTALKILFESEDPKNMPYLKFRRIELVALFNTFDRLSKSIEAINNFKTMYLKHLEDVAKGIAKPGEYDIPNNKGGLEFPFLSIKEQQKESASIKKASEQSKVSDKLSKSPLGKIRKDRTKYEQFKLELKAGLYEIYDALDFIYEAYAKFPFTMFKLSLQYLNGWWNVFIGRSEYVAYTSEQGFVEQDSDEIAYSRILNPL